MYARIFLNVRRLYAVMAAVLLFVAMAACGGAAEPSAGETQSAATAASSPAETDAGSTASEPAPPAANIAPKFELPGARGETVSLASYAGDKNVVLVFYRGFW